MEDTNKPAVAKINLAKLSGKGGRPFRYTETTELLEWRQEARAELATLKRLRDMASGDELREQRQHQVWKAIGEVACISRVLRDRLEDPEDLNWMVFYKTAKPAPRKRKA